MSAFRPKVKAVDSRHIRAARDQVSFLRMLLNGASEAHAYAVIKAKYETRKRKREERGF